MIDRLVHHAGVIKLEGPTSQVSTSGVDPTGELLELVEPVE
jgi:hypothetical protein